jgi:hypothetical protein
MTLGRKIVVALKAALTTWAIAILVLCVGNPFPGTPLSQALPAILFFGIVIGIAPALAVALPLSAIFLFGAPYVRRHGRLAIYAFGVAVSLLVTSPSLLTYPGFVMRPESLERLGGFLAIAYGYFGMVTMLPITQLRSCCWADVSPELLRWIGSVAALLRAITPGLVLAAFWQREVRRSAQSQPVGGAQIVA